MKPSGTENKESGVSVSVEIGKTLCFAMEQAGVPFVWLVAANFSKEPFEGATLDLELAPGLGDTQSFPLPTILPGATLRFPIPYLLAPGRLRQVGETEKGQVRWCVRFGGQPGANGVSAIDILPFNHYPGIPGYLSMFVVPNNPEVPRVLRQVCDRVMAQTGDAALDGYQSRNANRVVSVVRALYEVIQSLGIIYAEPPPSFEKAGQKVRLPDVLLRDRIGTCLDISLFFASCLEHMGLHPLVVWVEGHAFHAVWTIDDSFPELIVEDAARLRNIIKLGHLIALDSSTNVKTPPRPFEEAVAQANSILDKDDTFHLAIDIRTARRELYRPLPLRDESPSSPPEAPFPQSIPPAVVGVAPAVSAPPLATRPRAQPPPPAAATRFRKWQDRLLDLTLRNRLLNMGRPGRGWIPLDVPDLGVFEDVVSKGQSVEIRPIVGRPDAPFAEQRIDQSELLQRILADLSRGIVHVQAPPEDMSAILKKLERARRNDLEEGGANSLYAAMGLLKWKEPGVGDQYLAPLLLYPIELTFERARGRFNFRRLPDEPIGNTTLCEKLRREYRIDLASLADLEPDEHGVDLPGLIRNVRAAIQARDGWEVLDVALVGHFTFTKFLMWKDLEEHAAVLCENEFVRHIAERDSRFTPSGREVAPGEIDSFPPAATPCVMDADSTQMAAIASALAGRSFVLQGPPGTGKSQTITNLIAASLGAGKTVLFVSEKMAALEVVYKRLREAGLGDFCLELHSNKSNKRDVLDSLGRALYRGGRTGAVPWPERSAELAEVRTVLNAHAGAVNDKRTSGDTFYGVAGKLLAHAAEPDLGFQISDIETWTGERLNRTREIVADFALHASRVEPARNNVWSVSRQTDWSTSIEGQLRETLQNTRVSLDEVAGRARALAGVLPMPAQMSTTSMSDLAAVAEIRAEGPIPAFAFTPGFPAEAARVSAYAAARRAHEARRNEIARRWNSAFSVEDLSVFEGKFARWTHVFFLLAWIILWTARRAMKRFALGRLPSNRQISEDLGSSRVARQEAPVLASEQEHIENLLGGLWTAQSASLETLEEIMARASRAHGPASHLAAGIPGLVSAISVGGAAPAELGPRARELRAALENLSANEDALRQLIAAAADAWPPRHDPGHQEELRDAVSRWQSALGSFRLWCFYMRACAELASAGVAGVAHAHSAGNIESSKVGAAFERTVLSRLFAKLLDTDPNLKTFSGASHNRMIDGFSALDRAHIALARSLVAGLLEGRLPRPDALGAESSEPGILAREIQKKSRNIPIRRLLNAIPNLLPKLKPCLLMSPLSVAQYLPAGGKRFDIVVFDEASQIGTHDAIGAIARGNQVIVVGDSKQLPPTAFFMRAGTDDETPPDENDQEELESILDEAVAKSLPSLLLGWHYRSRHDSLIEFSNTNYYGGRLHVFPAAARRLADLGVSWHPVRDGVYFGGGSGDNARTNPREAQVLVNHLVRSLRRFAPGERTFGVVTFSLAQKALIDELLDDERAAHPEIEGHFQGGEPVFVKNLENVQGDERDEILFSICYAKDERGRLRLHFGPLSNRGGERRLNVAITRARVQLRVFSTLTHDQIDLSRTDARGARDLREFLEFAAKNGLPEDRALAAKNGHFPSHFERDIRDVIAAWGYDVHSQIGTGGYKIDLAIVHPREGGKYLLGVECDGPNYAKAVTARDRDRLRKQVLEGLGWRLHRVWSSDWILDRDAEVARLRAAIEQARAAPTPVVPPTPPVPEPLVEKAAPALTARRTARSAPPSPAKPYVQANLPAVNEDVGDLYEDSSADGVREIICACVNSEGPIHHDLVAQYVVAAFGLKKCTSKALDHIGAHIDGLVERRVIVRQGDFLWPATQDPGRYQGFRVPTDDGVIRDMALIAPEEIANAAAWVLEQSLSIDREELARETARLFGISRLGKNVSGAIDDALAVLAARRVTAFEGSRVVWKGAADPG